MWKVVIICTKLDMSAVSLSVIDAYKFCKNNKHLKMSAIHKFSDIRALVPLYCFLGLVTGTKVPSCYKVGGKNQSYVYCLCLSSFTGKPVLDFKQTIGLFPSSDRL